MDERFVAFATLVRSAAAASPVQKAPAAPAPRSPAPEPAVRANGAGKSPVSERVVRELTLMRLAAIEAYERSTTRLLRALADDVLARELSISSVDVDRLAKRLLATYAENEPVELVLSPADAARAHVSLPVRVDPELSGGDLVVRVRDGCLESRFTFRLEAAVRAVETDA